MTEDQSGDQIAKERDLTYGGSTFVTKKGELRDKQWKYQSMAVFPSVKMTY